MSNELPPNELPTETPVPAPSPAPQVPPPAATLVQNGEVKSERELALERDLMAAQQRQRDLETTVSERERDIQNLKAIPAPAPEKKPKRRGWTDPIWCDDEEAQ